MSNVLLLEPNTVLAQTYTAALEHAGHSVVHVTGAQVAINAADKLTPDIVILELQLPRHSGIEFLHEFRSYPEWSGIPVIVSTMLAPHQVAPVSHALKRDLGVGAILYKPRTTLHDIVRLIREYVVPATS